MANTHILEASFEVLNGAFARRPSCPRAAAGHCAAPSVAERWASLAADTLFAALERLKLCQGPRILRAECLVDNTMTQTAFSRRQ